MKINLDILQFRVNLREILNLDFVEWKLFRYFALPNFGSVLMKMNISKGILFLALIIGSNAYAQQEPQITHYSYSGMFINPAYTGIHEGMCASMLYHQQWSKFNKLSETGEVAPGTQIFNAQMPFNLMQKHKVGAGITFLSDNEGGFLKSTALMASGAYHKEFANMSASFGLNLGFNQRNNEPNYKSQFPDPSIVSDKVGVTNLEAGAGLYLNSPSKWYAGISALHLPSGKYPFYTRQELNKVARVYNFSGGYNIPYNPGVLDIQTGALIKTSDFKKAQYDLNARALYMDKFIGGLNYHSRDALSMMIGYYISSNFYMGYSYDLTISNAHPFGGKNEFYVSYCQTITLPHITPNHHLDTRNL